MKHHEKQLVFHWKAMSPPCQHRRRGFSVQLRQRQSVSRATACELKAMLESSGRMLEVLVVVAVSELRLASLSSRRWYANCALKFTRGALSFSLFAAFFPVLQ